MTEPIRVTRSAHGWWEVRDAGNRVLARYVSEFQAREAGREAAERPQSDLVIQQGASPAEHATFDRETGARSVDLDAQIAPSPDHAATATKRQLILLVEDHLDARELYAEYLNYAGFSVVTAINGHEAVRLARLLHPDLILMDIRMPGMDGLEATADLKADPDVAHIPIVALTADPSTGLIDRALAAGCAAFMSKPVQPEHVEREIRRVLAAQAS